MKDKTSYSLVPGREAFADVAACFAKRATDLEAGNNLSYAVVAMRLRSFAEGAADFDDKNKSVIE